MREDAFVRTRNRIALLVCLAPMLGVFAWSVWRPRTPDPVYKGKPLSVWLKGFDVLLGGGYAGREEAEEAVKAAGTNAIPLLLQMMGKKSFPLEDKLFFLWRKQTVVKHQPRWTVNVNAEAVNAFKVLGPRAKDAVPVLMKIYDENKDETSQACVVLGLAYIGPEASNSVPLLIRALSSGDQNLRRTVAFALGKIHSQPELVLPLLAGLLADNDRNVKQSAIRALASYGAAAKTAIPALVQVSHNDPKLRPLAEQTLVTIDPTWSPEKEQAAK